LKQQKRHQSHEGLELMATQHLNQDAARYVLSSPAQQSPTRKLDLIMQKSGDFVMEQWATIITAILGTLVFLAVSVPFLSYFGLDSIAKPIFFTLHYICAQIPAHSFYIFGHQLGFCERNLSIYSSMFIGGLIFVLSKKRLPGIPWWVWLLMILPMAWDGLTQMFGLRESTWVLRVITGSLFGFANIWFAFPLMHKTLQEPPPPQVRQVRRPTPTIPTTQLSGIERIAMAIRSILPGHQQHQNSVYHSHASLAHNQHMHRVYHAHSSSIYHQRKDLMYRVHDASNHVSNHSGKIPEE
jgi:uncharacterized membrane protein